MNRYKPVGWRYESHKHSLAAKGIKTKLYAKKENLSFSEFLNNAKGKEPEVRKGNCSICKEYKALKGTYCHACHAQIHGGKHEDKFYAAKTPLHDTAKTCHCGARYNGSDHCPKCGCEQYESLGCSGRYDAKKEMHPADVKVMAYGTLGGSVSREQAIADVEAGRAVWTDYTQSAITTDPKYFALKDFVGEAPTDKTAFLSNHKLDGEVHQLRHQDINIERQKALARMDAAIKDGDMNSEAREHFMKEDFKHTSQEYLNGYITKSQYDDEIMRELDYHMKVNRKRLPAFDWAEQKAEAKEVQK